VYELLFNISLSLFIGLLALTLIFYILARKLNYKFNFIEFIIYLTFYQPISALVLFTGILAALFSNNYKLDWKV
ncbi:MAG: hypothetical protein QXY75_07285, partial [Candidatus Bathyarchaeia archaeon]